MKRINNNKDRAQRALHSVNEYKAYCGETVSDRVETVTDLLCDLMHLCDRLGVDFDTRVVSARFHHDEEIREENEDATN
jgi:hypothetical protein